VATLAVRLSGCSLKTSILQASQSSCGSTHAEAHHSWRSLPFDSAPRQTARVVTQRQASALIILLSVILVIAVGSALRATYFITMPLVFAFFISVLVWPLHEGLRRRLPPRTEWLATVATMMTVLIGIAGVLGGVAFIVWRVAVDEGGELMKQWGASWETLSDWMRGQGLPAPAEGQAQEQVESVLEVGVQLLTLAASGITGIAAIVVLLFFFVLLMLVEACHWQEKVRAAFSTHGAEELMDALDATTHQVRTFILVQAGVSLVTALATALWLWVMGVPFVLLGGVLTFLLDFIPNIGPSIAGVVVTAVAVVTLGWEWAILTAVGVLAIQNVFGNYVAPVLHGRRLAISPLVVLLSVVFWAWVWGPAGAVIAVPITATLIVACAHVRALRPVAILLSRTADADELAEQTNTA
jgi:AI-2 transport protein TqsA